MSIRPLSKQKLTLKKIVFIDLEGKNEWIFQHVDNDDLIQCKTLKFSRPVELVFNDFNSIIIMKS